MIKHLQQNQKTVATHLQIHLMMIPMVEKLVSNIKNDFDEKASLARDSSNFQSIKCRINTNLYMYVQYQ